jgi:aspartate kinase
MSVIVQKFGGSSLADLGRLGQVADVVMRTRQRGHGVVVVVSAMGKTTDGLLELARQAASAGGFDGSEIPKRELDMLVSTGERVSMALLSIAIRTRGGDAVSFTGSQSGIITDERHFDARIVEVRPHRVEAELARGRIVIVAGYQGMSLSREITTLGRGGSDTTAVALAAALGAERCEIYSDVDGVYSADPRSVADALHLPELDYVTMQEMAECGAKVLNARAVEWARRAGIVIAARRTSDAVSGNAGKETLVSARGAHESALRAVVGDSAIALVRAKADAAFALLEAAREAELSFRDVFLDELEFRATFSLTNTPHLGRVTAALESAAPDGLRIATDLGSISVIGVGVGSDPTYLLRARAALASAPLLLSSSPLRLSAVIPRSEVASAERAFHAEFVGGAAASSAAVARQRPRTASRSRRKRSTSSAAASR